MNIEKNKKMVVIIPKILEKKLSDRITEYSLSLLLNSRCNPVYFAVNDL